MTRRPVKAGQHKHGKALAKRAMGRLEATDRTIARFEGKDWRPGSVDCFQLAIAHLRHFGWKAPKFAAYRTIAAGEAQMAALGLKTMADVIDHLGVPRHPAPAFAMLGDLVFMPGIGSTGPLGSICIALGNGGFKGFAEDHAGLVGLKEMNPTVAWSVAP